MIELVDDFCPKDCGYRMQLTYGVSECTHFCAYILLEQHSRGCDVSKCDKYRKGTKHKRARGFTIKWEVEDDSL